MIVSYLVFAAAGALVADDLPRIDLHVHLDDNQKPPHIMEPAEAAALAERMGVRFGVLGEGGCIGEIHDDQTLDAFLRPLAGLPLLRGIQVYGFDWPGCFSKENLARLDYIAADALVFPDRSGKFVRLWLPETEFPDPEDFMDRYVEFNVRVLSQPIQIWANATFLPASLQPRYDELWTGKRMRRVIEAAVKNRVAVEINSRYHIPSAPFIRMAKAAGAKFSFGSNGHVRGIGDIDFCIKTALECGLSREDIFVPAGR